jgi:hypothetical protein
MGWKKTVLHPRAEYCLYSTSEEPVENITASEMETTWV